MTAEEINKAENWIKTMKLDKVYSINERQFWILHWILQNRFKDGVTPMILDLKKLTAKCVFEITDKDFRQ